MTQFVAPVGPLRVEELVRKSNTVRDRWKLNFRHAALLFCLHTHAHTHTHFIYAPAPHFSLKFSLQGKSKRHSFTEPLQHWPTC